MLMLRRFPHWLLAFLLLFVAACDTGGPGDPGPDEDTGRGSLVASVLVGTATKDDLAQVGTPFTPQFDVDLIRLEYRTVDVAGNETVASGALFVPKGAVGALPLLSYQHGTIIERNSVASIAGYANGEANIAGIFASTGYIAVMPDYLGLGVSDVLHPYVHAHSLATAVVDMLRAARKYAEANNLSLNDKVLLTGYSEGGYATMAAHQQIEAQHASEFNLVASAPLAGPHDLSGTMADEMLKREPFPSPFYLPFTILAYDAVYDLYNSLDEVFVSPYSTTLPDLFDGTNSSATINAALPSIPIEAVRTDYADAFATDANHPLKQRLRENDLYNWTPQAPVRMIHCTEDDQVPVENSRIALQSFQQRGAADVSLVELDRGGHVACAPFALVEAKFWLDIQRAR